MKRQVDLSEISDGRLYSANDMVKADCGGCEGCFACCVGMGESIVLDPLDVHRLMRGLDVDFEGLLQAGVELHVVDGLILPNLKMTGKRESCSFLSEEGRCTVHAFRPGICRLFPLGRYYEDEGFRYFLQIHECRKETRGKIKVKKWLEEPNLKAYEAYILKWHRFLLACEEAAKTLDEENLRILTLYILKTFYQTPYTEADFYREFYRRLGETQERLGLAD